MNTPIEINGGAQDASVFASKDLLGCPWCNGTPDLKPMNYRNTGRLFGYKISCAACNFEKTHVPACWTEGKEAETMELARVSLVKWWNNRVQPNGALCDGDEPPQTLKSKQS